MINSIRLVVCVRLHQPRQQEMKGGERKTEISSN